MHFQVNKDLSHWFKIVCLLIPLWLFSDQLYAAANGSDSRKLLVLGDSLSAAYGLRQEQGWVSLLQNAWQDQPISVVNAAISGETTDGGLARLERLLDQHSPTHLYIELGGNDGLQGHPVNKMQKNIASMIELAQQHDIEVILQQMQIPTNYGRRYNEMFTTMFAELASQYEIALIPFFLQDIALDKTLMQRDGIHPNLEAQAMIAQFMQGQLEPLLQD